MTNSERASYIRGLMDGLELDPNAKETKVLNAIVELLDDLCVTVDEIDENMAELSGQVDEIDEDLGDLEDLPQLRRHHRAQRRHAGRGQHCLPWLWRNPGVRF